MNDKRNFYRETLLGDENCDILDDFINDFFALDADSLPNDSDFELDGTDDDYSGLGPRLPDPDYSDFTLRLADSDDDDDDFEPTLANDDAEGTVLAERHINNNADLVENGAPKDDIPVDDSLKDAEIARCRSFVCGCKRRCFEDVGVERFLQSRLDMLAIDNNEKDLIVMTAIQTHINASDSTSCSKRAAQKDRQRSRCNFYDRGIQICKNSFRFLYSISNDKFANIKKSYLKDGFGHVHKNYTGRKNAKTVIDFSGYLQFASFMRRYAREQGLVLPGRIPGMRNTTDVILLSTNETVANVHQKFNEARLARFPDAKAVSLTTFRRAWLQLCPNIVIATPRSDLCKTCQVNTENIIRSGGASLSKKAELIADAQRHIETAQKQREVYNQMIKESQEHVKDQELGPHEPNSFVGTVHYAFDFAQQIYYPADPMQVGPLYFLTPRKCQLFGICCTALPKQVNYLLDEAQKIRKGADLVVSLVDNFFAKWALGETKVNLHADNCCSQNKNNIMMAYLCWRCLTNKHKSITLNFLCVGHTKFMPDGAFGQVKKKLLKTRVDCLADIASVVNTSSKMNIAEVVANENGSNVQLQQRDWKDFLSQYFRNIKEIAKYHHFRFDADEPGIVYIKLYADDPEVAFNMLKKMPAINDVPKEIHPTGLPLQRQNYLYKEIRPYVRPELQDTVCPKPNADVIEESDSDEDLQDRENKRPCGPAKQPKKRAKKT